jgi:hypothetical protein
MYIKLNDEIINLDLIKKISKVVPILSNGSDGERFDSIIKTQKDELRWLDISNTGNKGQQEYNVAYGFLIYHLNEEGSQWIKVGASRNDAEKAREALGTLLNGNEPIMHVIKF